MTTWWPTATGNEWVWFSSVSVWWDRCICLRASWLTRGKQMLYCLWRLNHTVIRFVLHLIVNISSIFSMTVQFWETQEVFSHSVKLWTHYRLQKTFSVSNANPFTPYWAASRKTNPSTQVPHSWHLSQQYQVIYRTKLSEEANKTTLRDYGSVPKANELPT